MTVEEVLNRIDGLRELLDVEISKAYIQGDETDVTSLSADEKSPVTVRAFLEFLAEEDALDSLFGGSSTAELTNGELFVTAPQGTKG